MAWYKTGTVSVTNGSATVTGSGTQWVANVRVGDGFAGPDDRLCEITAISSDTSLTISPVYDGSTLSGQTYLIWPTSSFGADIVASLNSLISTYSTIATGPGAGKFASGTAALPGVAAAADLDTGVYWDESNGLGISTGGTQRIFFGSTGNIVVNEGGAAVDFRVEGTGATHLLFVDGSAGFVGINNSTPSVALDVTGSGAFSGAISAGVNANVGGVVLASDGSASAPAYAFTSDSNTGMFVTGPNSNELAFSAGGTQRFMLSATALTSVVPTRLADGIAAAPAYTFTGDTDTGIYNRAANELGFSVAGSEAFSIAAAGSSLAGTLTVTKSSDDVLALNRQGTDGTVIRIRNDGVTVGSISVSGSTTAYNTTSDYRAKENITPITDAVARVMALKPSRYNFIAHPGSTIDGFIAHEVSGVVPEAVQGEKDAMRVDENGDTVPDLQAMDPAKLVPLLTAALQEALTRIAALEAQ
jgi:hypothetical protein